MTNLKRRVLAAIFLLAGCAHPRAYTQVNECDQVPAEHRIACGACTLQNKAQGWLGDYEYRPDAKEGERCVRVK